MVVTSSAADGQTEKGRAGGGEHVIELVVANLLFVFLCVCRGGRPPWSGSQKSRGDHGLGIGGRILVTGNLPLRKGVEGEVLIQRPNHPVAIRPGMGAVEVGFVAIAVGVTSHIEPVPPPSFTVAGAREESVDEPLVGIGRRIFNEPCNVLGTGGQAVESKGDPADERFSGGSPRGDCVPEIPVNRIAPLRAQVGQIKRAKGPVLAVGLGDGEFPRSVKGQAGCI